MAAIGQALGSDIGEAFTVTIQIQNGKFTGVDRERFEIFKSKHQQVLWRISDPSFHFNIEFTDDSPFEYNQFSDLEPYSGLVRRAVLGNPEKYYNYTVTVTAPSKSATKKGNKTSSKPFDPGGVVNA